ncbi:MAG: replication-relaxation family protein [Dehalococcoidia bacterium]
MTELIDRLSGTLDWIVRLPLLGDRELGHLLGVHERDAHRLRLDLERRGWVESIVPRVEGLEERRLAVLRVEAISPLAEALSIGTDGVARLLPVRRRDTLGRLATLQVSAWMNRFAADLASTHGLPAVIADARSLPLAGRPSERWWLPGTSAYLCLRSGRQYAPSLLAWDRGAAPNQHRRRQVPSWYEARARLAAIWQGSGLPPLLVVAAGNEALDFWEHALLQAGERSEGRPLDVLLTTAHQVVERGPTGAIWREPGSSSPGLLVERIGWGEPPPIPNPRLHRDIANVEVPRSAPTLRAWASSAATDPDTAPRDRIAAIGICIDRQQRKLIEWIGRHPLLSVSDLVALVNEPAVTLGSRLEELVRYGVIRAAPLDRRSEPRGRVPEQGYLLTELGLLLLAAEAGVTTATFRRFGGMTVSDDDEPTGASRSLRHHDHTLGVNRFFARLALDARRAGWQLTVWSNEAESTRRFSSADGRVSWIRPDGSGVLASGMRAVPFLLEYDRGTLDAGDYAKKLDAYVRYFGAREWTRDFAVEPTLLFVCADNRAEARVRRAVAGASRMPTVLTTTEWRLEPSTGDRTGAFGAVWLQATAERGHLSGWPISDSDRVSPADCKPRRDGTSG